MKKILAVAITLMLATGLAYAEKIKIRWFVGLGGGSDAPTLPAQKAVVAQFNKTHDNIELVLEVVTNANAYSTLATEIAGGNAPDVVGPVGIKGRDSFKGAWKDMGPLVKKFHYDLSQYPKALVDFFRTKDEGLVGLPFAIYPSFLHVNKALFEEAGLPLPPTKYGEPYIDQNGKKWPWDLNTVKMLGEKLTVDANGNDATSPNFDSTKIVQFGYGLQMSDFRGYATAFGAGTFVAPNGKSAQIPSQWAKAAKFYQDAMWHSWWIPNGPYSASDVFNKGDLFASGKVAMVPIHTWYDGFAAIQKLDFDYYPMPAPPGKVKPTAKLHADTFEISRYTKHPDAAFEVLSYLLTTAAPELLKTYGGMPANPASQEAFLDEFLSSKFPGKTLNKSVIIASINYPDIPNHESFMPSFQEASNRYTDFWNNLSNDPKFNVNEQLPVLKADLTKIFRAAKK